MRNTDLRESDLRESDRGGSLFTHIFHAYGSMARSIRVFPGNSCCQKPLENKCFSRHSAFFFVRSKRQPSHCSSSCTAILRRVERSTNNAWFACAMCEDRTARKRLFPVSGGCSQGSNERSVAAADNACTSPGTGPASSSMFTGCLRVTLGVVEAPGFSLPA